jgi:hypothetical protein
MIPSLKITAHNIDLRNVVAQFDKLPKTVYEGSKKVLEEIASKVVDELRVGAYGSKSKASKAGASNRPLYESIGYKIKGHKSVTGKITSFEIVIQIQSKEITRHYKDPKGIERSETVNPAQYAIDLDQGKPEYTQKRGRYFEKKYLEIDKSKYESVNFRGKSIQRTQIKNDGIPVLGRWRTKFKAIPGRHFIDKGINKADYLLNSAPSQITELINREFNMPGSVDFNVRVKRI